MRHFNYDIHECSSLSMNARKRVPAIKLRDPCSRSACTHCTHDPSATSPAKSSSSWRLVLVGSISAGVLAQTDCRVEGRPRLPLFLAIPSTEKRERERERTRVVRSVVLTLEIREGDDQEICSTTSTYNAARCTWPLPVLSRLLFFLLLLFLRWVCQRIFTKNHCRFDLPKSTSIPQS
jgi:hypothetical protein